MRNKYLLFFGTSAFLKCLDSREEIQMKINQLIVTLFLILGFFGCGTSSANTPSPQNEVLSKQKLEKAPNPEGLRHFMDGQMMLNQGDFALAILEFQQALELDPGVGAIHTSIAECYWNLGKAPMAEKHLKLALALDPKDSQALNMLADQYILQKNYERAQKSFEELHVLKPDEVRYIIALGELEKIKKNYLESLELYLKAFMNSILI